MVVASIYFNVVIYNSVVYKLHNHHGAKISVIDWSNGAQLKLLILHVIREK